MIVVKLEMWPQGSEKDKYELGRTYIANVGGTRERGNYKAAVCRKNSTEVPNTFWPKGPEPIRTGSVEDYPRLTYNVWRLIIRALKSAFPEEK